MPGPLTATNGVRLLEPPYIIAEIELVEQPGLRLLSNVLGCEPEDVFTGQAVEVCFARSGQVHIPLFRVSDQPGEQ